MAASPMLAKAESLLVFCMSSPLQGFREVVLNGAIDVPPAARGQSLSGEGCGQPPIKVGVPYLNLGHIGEIRTRE